MEEDQDFFREDAEFRDILDRYERMNQSEKSQYFDVYQFERIIDHYLDGNKFKQAEKAIRIAINQHPASNALILKRAQIYAEKGEPAKAIRIITDLERTDHYNHELYMLKGMVLAQTGKLSEAEKAFETALSMTYEKKEDLLFDIALSFQHIHQYKLAVKYLRKAHVIQPEDLNFLYELAFCYEKLREYGRSIKYYKDYLDREPFSENVWLNLGHVYFKTEDYGKAIEAYDFAITINDKYASAYLNKAITLSHAEDYMAAVGIFLEFIELEPENVPACCYLGECYEKTGNYEESIHWYKKAIHLDPDFSESWYGIAVCYQRMNKYRYALKNIRKAIELDDQSPDYWFTLGVIEIKLGNKHRAIQAFEKSTELDPYDYEAWLNHSQVELSLNGIIKAILVLKDAYHYNFDIPEINYQLAAYYCLSGEMELLYNFFEKGLQLSAEGYSLVFRFCPELKNEKNIQILISKYNPNSLL